MTSVVLHLLNNYQFIIFSLKNELWVNRKENVCNLFILPLIGMWTLISDLESTSLINFCFCFQWGRWDAQSKSNRDVWKTFQEGSCIWHSFWVCLKLCSKYFLLSIFYACYIFCSLFVLFMSDSLMKVIFYLYMIIFYERDIFLRMFNCGPIHTVLSPFFKVPLPPPGSSLVAM